MSRRAEWQKVLDAEVKRWSAMSCEQLLSELYELQAYEVEFTAGKGIPTFLAISSGMSLGGYYLGRGLDRRTTLIRVVP